MKVIVLLAVFGYGGWLIKQDNPQMATAVFTGLIAVYCGIRIWKDPTL